jgi:hypothetical protein
MTSNVAHVFDPSDHSQTDRTNRAADIGPLGKPFFFGAAGVSASLATASLGTWQGAADAS